YLLFLLSLTPFVGPLHTIASTPPCPKFPADQADQLTHRLNRHDLCQRNSSIRIICSRACRMGFPRSLSPAAERWCSSLDKRLGTNGRTSLAETAFLSRQGRHSATLERRWKPLAAR